MQSGRIRRDSEGALAAVTATAREGEGFYIGGRVGLSYVTSYAVMNWCTVNRHKMLFIICGTAQTCCIVRQMLKSIVNEAQ